MNHCYWPSGMWLSSKLKYSLYDLNHLPPKNTAISKIQEDTSLRCYYHLFSSNVISVGPEDYMLTDKSVDIYRCFILSSSSTRTGILAVTNQSSRIDLLIATIIMLSSVVQPVDLSAGCRKEWKLPYIGIEKYCACISWRMLGIHS